MVVLIFAKKTQRITRALYITVDGTYYVVETGTVVAMKVFATLVARDACTVFAASEAVVLGILHQMLKHYLDFYPFGGVKVIVAVSVYLNAVPVQVYLNLTFLINKGPQNLPFTPFAKHTGSVRNSLS